MRRFEGQTILVTGASSGIGLATAKRLSSEGARVVGVARDQSKLQKAVDELRAPQHKAWAGNLESDEDRNKLLVWLKTEAPCLNGFVHAAGSHSLRPLKAVTESYLADMLRNQTVATIMLTKSIAFAGVLTPGAAIVWISSVAALRATPGAVAYSAAKGALQAAARTLAAELVPRDVRINVVSPGVVRTPQSEAFLGKLLPEQAEAIRKSHPLGLGEAADVAGAVTFLLSSDARWITGIDLVVDGGFSVKP